MGFVDGKKVRLINEKGEILTSENFRTHLEGQIPVDGSWITYDAIEDSVRTNNPSTGVEVDKGLDADNTLMRIFPENSNGLQIPSVGWSEYKVYTSKEGWYSVRLNLATSGAGEVDVQANALRNETAITATGALDKFNEKDICDVWLPTGWSTIRIRNIGNADFVLKEVSLRYNSGNTKAAPISDLYYLFNNYTRGYAGPYKSSSMGCFDFDGPYWKKGYWMVNRTGKGSYVTFEMVAPKAGWYNVTLGYGLGGTTPASYSLRVNSQNEGPLKFSNILRYFHFLVKDSRSGILHEVVGCFRCIVKPVAED